MQLPEKATQLVSDVKQFWRVPPPGRYMTFKEILSYSGGGIGIYSVITVINAMLLSTTNTLIGNTIGIAPDTLYLLYILGIVASFPLTGLRANIIDNTRSKQGKYRPYIMKMGIPATILAIGFVWMPYEIMSMPWKCITVLAFNIGFQFFFNFFRESYENLIYVLSPNSQERTDVAAIKSVLYSLAPSIIQPMMPLLAKVICNGDLNDIRLYRYAYPPIAVVGMMISFIVFANTREKIIQAKTHIIQIKFLDALKAVAKNKYFWIISCAGWIGFLEGAQGQIMYWLYQYEKACTPAQYTIITFLYGNASLWGMVFAPIAIRRMGKKKVLILTNVFNVLFIGLLYPFIDQIWLVLFFMYMNALVGSFAHVLDPSVQADIRDYQQYVTGERIDGMFAAVGLIGSVITLVTSGVLPLIYKTVGNIDSGNGYANPYDVLYEHAVFTKLIHVLILLSVVGAALNVIPYFFYDLTEIKQKGMVKVLQVRALFEDYGNGALSDEDLVTAIDLVNESRSYVEAGPVEASKKGIQDAKSAGGKPAVKAAKKAYRKAVEHNKMVEISQFVVDEMNKFQSVYMMDQVKLAKQIVSAGLEGLSNVDNAVLAEAKRMPRTTDEEKKIRKEAISLAKKRLTSKKLIKKHFSGGIDFFDTSVFDKLFAQEDALELKLEEAYRTLFAAKEQKDRAAVKAARAQVQSVKAERKGVRAKIKQATNENSLFNRAAKPYMDARNLILQEENFKHYDEIAAQYEGAKERAQAAREKQKKEADEKAALKKEQKELARMNRKK